jgi:mannose-1-phosphate guanylyltransferase
MFEHCNTWALVLAAGEGSRLRNLTTTAAGLAVPKQFCSLRGGTSLLHEALQRAWSMVPPARTCTIVAAQHRRWWRKALASMPPANVIVQPNNRGTAIGVLLSLLRVARCDRNAVVIILPSDHHVRLEERLLAVLHRATDEVRSLPGGIVMLGVEPDEADSELGYIVPGRSQGDGSLDVERFVEKPALAHARQLIEQGALWNSFIIVASVRALLDLYETRYGDIALEMRMALFRDMKSAGRARAIDRLYQTLPVLDFSRDILQGQERRLRVLRVPPCGWSDLGTPKRVADTLRRLPYESRAGRAHCAGDACLNLATQQTQLRIPAPPASEQIVS